jgi:hypothetical protein
MMTTFDTLHIKRLNNDTYEFSASSGDERPQDRKSVRLPWPIEAWKFIPRRSDLPDTEWAEIKRLVETIEGDRPDWRHPRPWARSWTFFKTPDGSWVNCPF